MIMGPDREPPSQPEPTPEERLPAGYLTKEQRLGLRYEIDYEIEIPALRDHANAADLLLEQKDREIRSLKISVENLLGALILLQRQGHQDACDKIISSGVSACDCGYDLAERALQWERNNG